MPSARKWLNPIYTPVRLEKVYKDLAEVLGIGFTEAANAGLELLIEDRLTNIADPRVTPEMVAQYRGVKNHHLKELEIVLHRRSILDAKTKEFESRKEEIAQARKALIESAIEVWDYSEEKYKHVLPPGVEPIPGVPLEAFRSEIHLPVRHQAVAEEGD